MFNVTPLLLKHFLVGILPTRTLQVVVVTFGNAFSFHRYLNASWWGALSYLVRHSYAEFIEKSPDLSVPHTWTSFSSLVILALDICITRSASNKDYHSNLARLHLNLHRHTDSSYSLTSSTFWPWFNVMEYTSDVLFFLLFINQIVILASLIKWYLEMFAKLIKS